MVGKVCTRGWHSGPLGSLWNDWQLTKHKLSTQSCYKCYMTSCSTHHCICVYGYWSHCHEYGLEWQWASSIITNTFCIIALLSKTTISTFYEPFQTKTFSQMSSNRTITYDKFRQCYHAFIPKQLNRSMLFIQGQRRYLVTYRRHHKMSLFIYI